MKLQHIFLCLGLALCPFTVMAVDNVVDAETIKMDKQTAKMSAVFTDIESEMKGLEWGRLYDTYHKKGYNPADVSKRVHELYQDFSVKDKKGIFEYILGGEQDKRLLEIRIFDDPTKMTVYKRQTAAASEKGESNCPLCALGNDNNRTRLYKFTEMDADHVAAWSKGGETSIENCQMLCKTHNRAKGNR